MTNEITRENVQEILDRNSTEYKRKEADMEAQERQLRLTINGNHATKTMTESQRAMKEQAARDAALAKRQERRAELAQEAEDCNTWYQFMLLVFAPLILAACLVRLAGGAPITIPLLICMTAYVALILVTSIKVFFSKSIKTLAAQIWPKVKEYIMYLSMV